MGNHIMLQAQAKRKMVAGARRMSAVVRRASVVVRRSFMEAIGGGNNKICVGPIDDCLSTTTDDDDEEESEKKNANRFSIPEITEDEYDAINIEQDVKSEPKEVKMDLLTVPSHSQSSREHEESIAVNKKTIQESIEHEIKQENHEINNLDLDLELNQIEQDINNQELEDEL